MAGQITSENRNVSRQQMFDQVNKQTNVIIVSMNNHRRRDWLIRDKRLYDYALAADLRRTYTMINIADKSVETTIGVEFFWRC